MIRKAKELLMARNNMTEEEAHQYLQKNSMDNLGTDIVETAEMVLNIMDKIKMGELIKMKFTKNARSGERLRFCKLFQRKNR